MEERTGNAEVTGALYPVSGVSRDGRPLSCHRAPAPDLAPWIARMFVIEVDQPSGQTLRCGLLNDTPFVRLMVRGEWTALTSLGPQRTSRGAVMFGPHSRRMEIEVTGSFVTFGFALKPGALAALGYPWGPAETDSVALLPAEGRWRSWARIEDWEARSPVAWLDWLEDTLRAEIPPHAAHPDPLAEALDRAAFADPGEPIGAFARRHGVSTRRVERMARRDFGLSPKQVMRRARALDMASQLLGFGDAEEAAEQALRFYDQSHLIRDFRALFGCTPSQLASAPQPLLAAALEARQARRLELLGRLDAARPAPWR